MYGDESIKARIIYEDLSLIETLALCIKDIHERKLRPMFKLPSKMEYQSFCESSISGCSLANSSYVMY